MFVHEDDAIGALERRTCRADVYARWFRTVLTHYRQRLAGARIGVSNLNFPDPLGVGRRSVVPLQAVFPDAGNNALVALAVAAVEIDQHAPAHIARGSGIERLRTGG